MRWIGLAVLSFGCASTEDTQLSRLTRAWAVETAEAAGPAVTATVLMGALSAALCAHRADEDFLALGSGDELPLHPALEAALGSPKIEAMGVEGGLSLVLTGVDVLDRTAQLLRIKGTEDGTQYSVEIDALIDDGVDAVEVAKLVSFGQLRLDLDSGCSSDQSLARGKALWIDTTERRHDVQLPADSELGGDLSFGGPVPYLPRSGAIGWSARVDGQERTVTSEDAGEIRVDSPDGEVPTGRWPVIARGPGWSGNTFTLLEP
jgi:hypothetical protein